jgi:hypothetical protein
VESELVTLSATGAISSGTGELGNLRGCANPRNFQRLAAAKELTNGQRQFEGRFWLPSLDTFRTFLGDSNANCLSLKNLLAAAPLHGLEAIHA